MTRHMWDWPLSPHPEISATAAGVSGGLDPLPLLGLRISRAMTDRLSEVKQSVEALFKEVTQQENGMLTFSLSRACFVVSEAVCSIISRYHSGQ